MTFPGSSGKALRSPRVAAMGLECGDVVPASASG